jgi:hypothetical protein
MMVVGVDRILFSTDWLFENIDHAAIWFDAATISEEDRPDRPDQRACCAEGRSRRPRRRGLLGRRPADKSAIGVT